LAFKQGLAMIDLQLSTQLETIYAHIVRLSLQQIAICSLQANSGNTTLALALARRAASSGKKVLLIELNISHPKLHTLPGLKRSEWLPIEQSWQRGIQLNVTPFLSILTTPKESGHHVEFHDLDTLKSFFKQSCEKFDLVFCDCSPLLLSSSGEIAGALICSASDSTLLNVLTNINTEGQLEEANEILTANDANLIGVVMNDQFAPSLKSELIRESHRLDRWLPRLMNKVRIKLRHSDFLSQDL